jgi:hypothetical protein
LFFHHQRERFSSKLTRARFRLVADVNQLVS